MIDSQALTREERWPELPWREWAPTIATLHMWTQIVANLGGWDRAALEPAVLPDRPPTRPWSTQPR
jgi:hypothetical protein